MTKMQRILSGLSDVPLTDEHACHGGVGTIQASRLLVRHDFTAPVEWVDFVEVPPGATIGLHLQEEDELYLFASGRGRMTVDGAAYEVSRGDAVLTRAGSTHSLENHGPEKIVFFVVQVARA
jgi:mannose-6-phosphate isomerase-like protein (cupin superfamily)